MPLLTDITVPETDNKVANAIISVLNGRQLWGIKTEEPIQGPIICGYPLKVPPSISIKKLFGLEEDIAMATGVESCTIQRIGNRVIVFIPNKDRKVVNFLDSLSWFLKDEKIKEMQLPILLGQDFEGNNAAIDLIDQPHILIAGSTGAGKSVFESSIIAALSTAKSAKELQLYLVDTKRLDLTLFEGLAQTKEVVRTAQEWYQIANFLYSEVQRRNILLEKFSCRNIGDYNEKIEQKLPYIVLIIDELADLMEKDKAIREEKARNDEEHFEPKVIDALRKINQVSRAAGIHIIAGTQRTSVDVVSGIVKANFPTRISLRLPTGTDSRTIIGTNGAENLLGNGDMLIQHSDSEIIKRYHAPFVRMEDINAIISQMELIKEQLGV